MSLKCLNPDGIRPLAGRSQSSALVCSVDNTSSYLRGVDHEAWRNLGHRFEGGRVAGLGPVRVENA
jgi:hypothetical protein